MKANIVYPDYSNSITNLANSILQKWGFPINGGTLELLDPYLVRDHKNIVVFLLDGLGKCIIERNLEKNGFLNSHLAGTFSSTFPSTTVAATASVDSGLAPCEHGWLGWTCYFPQIDRNVSVYRNTDPETGETVAEKSVVWTYCRYPRVIDRINAAGGKGYYVTPFVPPYPESFDACCELIKAYCQEPGQKYIYCYCDEPDNTIHLTGCYSGEAKQVVSALERRIETLAAELKDTLIIVTADHGMVDVKGVCIKDYPAITDCLKRIPTIEPRALNLFVKEDKRDEFEKAFTGEFGQMFQLLPKAKVLEMKLFGSGNEHKDFRSMLGDYVAVAVADVSIFNFQADVEKFVAGHAGLTEDEMVITMIVFETN